MDNELFDTLYQIGWKSIEQLIASNDEALHVKGLHCKSVTEICAALKPNDNLAVLCGLYHDFGRTHQHQLFGGFLDKELSHNYIGADRFDHVLIDNKINMLEPLCALWTNVIRDVILYHGKVTFFNIYLSEESKEYVNIVSIADDMENACNSVLYYFEKETQKDKKNYRKNNPQLDQKSVSNDVLEHLKNLEKFNVVKYCNTYAEHLIFYFILLINACKYPIAKEMLKRPVSNFSSAIDGYKYLIKTYIGDTNIQELCYQMLEKHS